MDISLSLNYERLNREIQESIIMSERPDETQCIENTDPYYQQILVPLPLADKLMQKAMVPVTEDNEVHISEEKRAKSDVMMEEEAVVEQQAELEKSAVEGEIKPHAIEEKEEPPHEEEHQEDAAKLEVQQDTQMKNTEKVEPKAPSLVPSKQRNSVEYEAVDELVTDALDQNIELGKEDQLLVQEVETQVEKPQKEELPSAKPEDHN